MLKFRVHGGSITSSTDKEENVQDQGFTSPWKKQRALSRNELVSEEGINPSRSVYSRRYSMPEENFNSIVDDADVLRPSTKDDSQFVIQNKRLDTTARSFVFHSVRSPNDSGLSPMRAPDHLLDSANYRSLKNIDTYAQKDERMMHYQTHDDVVPSETEAEDTASEVSGYNSGQRYAVAGVSSVTSLPTLNSRAPLHLHNLDFSELGVNAFDRSGGVPFSLKSIPRLTRRRWNSRMQFVLLCLGLSLGIQEVSLLPIQAFSDGKGGFIFVYILVTLLAGLPLVYLQCLVGQYWSLGGWGMWKVLPLCRGIGSAVLCLSFVMALKNSVTIAHSLYYLVLSCFKVLPWTECNPDFFSDDDCGIHPEVLLSSNIGGILAPESCSLTNYSDPICNVRIDKHSYEQRPSVKLWLNFVLSANRNPFEEFPYLGSSKWDLILALAVSWFIIFACVCKGSRQLGKISYLLVGLPLTIFVVILLRAVTLMPTSLYEITQQVEQLDSLRQLSTWVEGGKAAIVSLLVVSGGAYVTIASHNKFNSPLHKDVPIFILVHLLFVLFSTCLVLGVKEKQDESLLMVIDGYDFAFTLMLDKLSQSQLVPALWNALFFLMLALLECGTVSVLVFSIQTALEETLPQCRRYKSRISLVLVTVGFLFAVTFTTERGRYLYQLYDAYVLNPSSIFLGLSWLFALGAVYRGVNVCENTHAMLGSGPSLITRLMWWFLCPVIFLFFLVTYFCLWQRPIYLGHSMSEAASTFGWFIAAAIMVQAPLVAVYELLKSWMKGERIEKLFSPNWSVAKSPKSLLRSSTTSFYPRVRNPGFGYELNSPNGSTVDSFVSDG